MLENSFGLTFFLKTPRKKTNISLSLLEKMEKEIKELKEQLTVVSNTKPNTDQLLDVSS